jgi:hypothetical protein
VIDRPTPNLARATLLAKDFGPDVSRQIVFAAGTDDG